jgi:hypothetical protein
MTLAREALFAGSLLECCQAGDGGASHMTQSHPIHVTVMMVANHEVDKNKQPNRSWGKVECDATLNFLGEAGA